MLGLASNEGLGIAVGVWDETDLYGFLSEASVRPSSGWPQFNSFEGGRRWPPSAFTSPVRNI